MKILFFSTYYYPYISGLTVLPQRIFLQLSKKHHIKILTFQHNRRLSLTDNIDGTQIIRMPYWFKIFKGFVSPQSILFFLKEIRKTQLVIINIPNVGGLCLLILAKLMKKKVIGFFHCQLYFKNNILKKFIALVANLLIFVQFCFIDEVIAFSEDYVSSVIVGKIFKKKFHYFLPPIDKLAIDNIYLKKILARKKDQVYIGFVGRIAREKGLFKLVQAVKKLSSQYQLQLVFAGPFGDQVAGENTYYEQLLTLLNKENIAYSFFGELSREQLGAFYQAIDVLALPSINKTEAFGLVQAEAMLLGTPVVAGNLPGVRTSINLTGMGVIYSVEDKNGLANAIKTVIDHRTDYTNPRLIKKSHQVFINQQAMQTFSKLLLDLYK